MSVIVLRPVGIAHVNGAEQSWRASQAGSGGGTRRRLDLPGSVCHARRRRPTAPLESIVSNPDIEGLGPLAPLAGTWEGAKGEDIAPSDDRGVATSPFRERMVFTPIGRVDNHEQTLYGLRYATTAWRAGAEEPFHEEVGYWLWDAERKQVMRCFIVPRGVTVIAGATVEPDATSFTLQATAGAADYGICSNPFLLEQFRTERYELTVELLADGRLSYEEDTVMAMKGRDEPFHHTDKNVLTKVAR